MSDPWTEINRQLREDRDQLITRARALEEALEMVLLYHSGSPWDVAKAKRWERWTGSGDASTRALCGQLRTLLEAKP